MRFITRILLLVSVAVTFANAQLPTFQHIIIIVQENRTPDNLFGSNTTFEPGVDLANAPNAVQWCLGACFDPDHSNNGWQNDYYKGNWCDQRHVKETDCPHSTCNGLNMGQLPLPACPQESYVSAQYDKIGGSSVVAPYFDIAMKYGFANYFFQSNQGPSFSAHQFLFSGTSAPSGIPPATDYQYFASGIPKFGGVADTGCVGNPQSMVTVIDQTGNENNLPEVFPCFYHNSLPTLLDPNHISWKYYGVVGSRYEEGRPTGIWTAPNSIAEICFPPDSRGTTCTGSDWINDVVFDKAGILNDLGVANAPCGLRNVSWVIPNGDRSDHPGFGDVSTKIEHGPAWVADIINAVGQSPCTDQVNGVAVPFWKDTAIFVVWDDWGGFWDHVAPYQILVEGHNKHCVPTQTFGCGYTSGFRVPFLVVSAYTPAGYVSGDTRTQGEQAKYTHDFGSILAFIEYNFLGSGAIGTINAQNNYKFADAFAPDYTAPPNLHVPLADFFPLTTARQFQAITLPSGAPSATDFINYNGPDEDPDNDAIDND